MLRISKAFTIFQLLKQPLMKIIIFKTSFIALLITLAACGGSDKKTTLHENPTKADKKKDTAPKPPVTETRKPAIINIIDTVSPKMIVVFMKDSAASSERISLKLGQIYGAKLAQVFKQNKIKMTAPPMTWYKSQKPPFFFEAGIPVNKRPAKLPKAVFVKDIAADNVIMAHFYGPFDMTGQAYEALNERMKDTKRRAKGPVYEIYVTDPIDKNGKMIDPYKVRTDIVLPVY